MTKQEAKSDLRRAVIRRRSLFLGCWVLITVLMVMVVFGVVAAPPDGSSLGENIGLAALTCVGVWFISLVGRRRVIVDGERIRIVNMFQRWDIPWTIVNRVESSNQVSIQLVDGRTIALSITSASLLENLRGNRLQRRVSERIEQYRPKGVAKNREFVLEPKLALAPVALAILVVVVVGLTILNYALSH